MSKCHKSIKDRAKTRWLDRRIAAPGPFLTLCLSEGQFKAAIKHMRIPGEHPFVKTAHSQATAHLFDGPGGLAAVVCLRDFEGRDPVEVAGILVHEAVHVWQEYAAYIGEKAPGVEQEAYAIQSIAQELMAEFARQQAGGRS